MFNNDTEHNKCYNIPFTTFPFKETKWSAMEKTGPLFSVFDLGLYKGIRQTWQKNLSQFQKV